jgi:hypothetical protein
MKRLGLGGRLLLFSSVLLAIPWLGYRYIDEMKEFLLNGQQEAQLLAVRAVATVLHDRSDLFEPAVGWNRMRFTFIRWKPPSSSMVMPRIGGRCWRAASPMARKVRCSSAMTGCRCHRSLPCCWVNGLARSMASCG